MRKARGDMGNPRNMLMSHAVERHSSSFNYSNGWDMEKNRLNHEYLGVKLTVLDYGWDKNGDRRRKLMMLLETRV